MLIVFWGNFIFLLLVIRKFLEPNRSFTFQMGPMFVTVLSVPQNQEYPDRTVSLSYLPANCSAVNIRLLECHQRQQHEMLGPVVKNDKLGNHCITHPDDDNNPSGWMAEVSLKAAIL